MQKLSAGGRGRSAPEVSAAPAKATQITLTSSGWQPVSVPPWKEGQKRPDCKKKLTKGHSATDDRSGRWRCNDWHFLEPGIMM